MFDVKNTEASLPFANLAWQSRAKAEEAVLVRSREKAERQRRAEQEIQLRYAVVSAGEKIMLLIVLVGTLFGIKGGM